MCSFMFLPLYTVQSCQFQNQPNYFGTRLNTHSPNGFRSIHLCSHMIECICWSKTSGKFAPVNIFITEVKSVWDVWIAVKRRVRLCDLVHIACAHLVYVYMQKCQTAFVHISFVLFPLILRCVTSWAKTLVHSPLIVDPTSVFWWHLVQAGLSDPTRQAMHCAETSLCSKSLS